MTRTPSPLAGRMLTSGLNQLVRRGLRGVWVRGELPAGATVWAANHHSWWDGFIASAVLSVQQRPGALLMAGENLADFRFLAPLGVIPTGHLRQALQALRDGRVLVIFPERELRAAGPLGDLAPGAAWLAAKASAELVPVAVRIANRGHQYPEAYVDIGAAVPPSELAAALAGRLQQLDTELLAADPREPLAGFRHAVPGRASWDERITRVSKVLRR